LVKAYSIIIIAQGSAIVSVHRETPEIIHHFLGKKKPGHKTRRVEQGGFTSGRRGIWEDPGDALTRRWEGYNAIRLMHARLFYAYRVCKLCISRGNIL